MNRLIHLRRYLLPLLLAGGLFAQPVQAALVKIGVYSPEGFETGMQRWQPSADYLTRQLPQWQFQVLPYQDLAELEQDARRGKFDFVLTQPASFVRLEQQAGLLRLLTRIHGTANQPQHHSGMVVFTRADNARLQRLTDLADTPFVTTRAQDYSGWQLVQLELLRRQQDPDELFSAIEFAGNADAVLDAVMAGDYPAGAMAADEFDRLLREGRVSLPAVRVLEARHSSEFPFRYSGNLYPQWPLGALPDTPSDLRQAVMTRLQSLPANHRALQAGQYAGWQAADNYHMVRPLLEKSLTRHVVQRQLNVANLWLSRHQPALLLSLGASLLLWLLIRLTPSRAPRHG